jgi:hypothetical protein
VVFINPVAVQYIIQNGLPTRETLIKVAKQGLVFPGQSIELKTEWIPLTPSQSNYVTAMRGTQRYGLVAFHLKAKVLPNAQWLWATFIHKDRLPAGFQVRDLFGRDPDGSISAALQALFVSEHTSILADYLLIGTQTNLDLSTGNVLLGNPLIEGLADPKLQHSSCAGCHNSASISDNGVWSQPSVQQNPSPGLQPGMFPTDDDWGTAGKPVCNQAGIGCYNHIIVAAH